MIFFVNQIRNIIDHFLNGYGLFYDIWSPLAESAIYLICAIIGGYYIGLNGILLGNLISLLLIICILKPFFLFTRGFNLSVRVYWINIFKYLLIWLSNMCIIKLLSIKYIHINSSENFYNWILYSIMTILMFLVAYFLLLFLFTRGMRDFVKRFINLKK